jgi:long-chain acyl-CoA synthetase|uniref:Long-chain-fatty-acid--CoA ligase n=1 Tax=Eutreptiella gymnastica TaxID=73025 RepID=A0A7S4C7T2_9EUGL|mmetsp:Transcript_87655/g.145638  ORF Transcript_87655/g.145638 Transcript_87655/m.145638 type:complete len:723 (+) Transcript_87655:28-2196(+)|eukprot:CAMPEP_0174293356 /NCGR_PEP_ID=MMETSP0809-20121228/38278_1 /TAXON_ID=73025 ORGANISM="Eutreptiella gymnastica-like, Strain CCMP1594" /NCGR_SAMPLE_ID=MMETSP0809 /ASSEMBLY_ACC=CAM_ASM_000658 /LENGTH=722 /DNA_ID=CAMNT_0015394057 /DNA_START=28 /DNA_END=2196 /DNA_ORIENTATION=+
MPEVNFKTVLASAVVVGAAAAIIAHTNASRPVPVPDSYSYVVPGSEDLDKGLGAIYRANAKADLTALEGGASTGYEVFQAGVKLGGDAPCMGWRKAEPSGKMGPYEFQTYNEVNTRMANFAAGLEKLGLIPEIQGTPETTPMKMLALFMKNRAEWIIAEQACYRQGATTVPMYDTLGADVVEMVLNETELQTVVCTSAEVKALVSVKPKCPSLTTIIQTNEVTKETLSQAAEAGLKIYSFEEVEKIGAENPVPPNPANSDGVATFCYTSGTTGKAKGALLTHKNMMSVIAAAYERVSQGNLNIGPGDRHLSYLPLAHVFERCVIGWVFSSGACVGFFQGDTRKLAEDLAALKPTIFPSVPRLLNRFYEKVFGGVKAAGGIKAKLFMTGYAAKQQGLKNGHVTHFLWDKLVFGKIAKKLGLGECKVVITGSAPIAPHVIEFLRILLSCHVLEGYGQTEVAGASTLQFLGDQTTGNVGAPLACNSIRLVSVPDMGYLVTDTMHGKDEARGVPGMPCKGRGEIWTKGSNVFLGYYKMPEKTEETLDEDGWVHSGDIGVWTEKGQLKIVDRKKNIFKLAQGEYIAPEKIENVYGKVDIVAQSFVYGDSFQHQLVAIVVPDLEAIPTFCKAHDLPVDTPEALCKNPDFIKAVHVEMDTARKEAKLFGFEHAAKIYLDPTPFSVDNDLLTPTFKLKRDIAKKYYQAQIDEMYDSLEGVAGAKGLKQTQ